jgi:hypothetical protein
MSAGREFFGPTIQVGPGDIGEPYPDDDEGCPECGADLEFAGALLSCSVCDWDASCECTVEEELAFR